MEPDSREALSLSSTQAIKSQERPMYIVTPPESRRTSKVIAMQVKASKQAMSRMVTSHQGFPMEPDSREALSLSSTQAIKSQERPMYIVTPEESRRSSDVVAMQVKASKYVLSQIITSDESQ